MTNEELADALDRMAGIGPLGDTLREAARRLREPLPTESEVRGSDMSDEAERLRGALEPRLVELSKYSESSHWSKELAVTEFITLIVSTLGITPEMVEDLQQEFCPLTGQAPGCSCLGCRTIGALSALLEVVGEAP